MTIFNVTGGSSGGGGDGSPTFKQMINKPYEITAADWGEDVNLYQVRTYQFYNDRKLTRMELPSRFNYIGERAFQSCTNLVSITMPNTLNTLNQYAFASCTSLESFTVPDAVSTVQNFCCSYCSKIETLTIGSGVTNIKASAFTSIGTNTSEGVIITMKPTTPPTIVNTSFSNALIKKIIVPQGTLSTYQSASIWSNFANLMEEAS